MDSHKIIRGFGLSITSEIRDGNGAWVADYYDGSEALVAHVWAGDARLPLFDASPEWSPTFDTSEPEVVTWIDGSDTSGLEPGTYRVIVVATKATVEQPVDLFDIEILPGPGTDEAPFSYVSFDQVRMYSPEVDRVLDDSDVSGFGEQLARASAEFDRWVLNRYSPQPGRSRRLVDGCNVFSLGPNDESAPTRQEIAALLGTDAVILSPDVIETVAMIALSIIYLGSPGRDSIYRETGNSFKAFAMASFRRCFVELDGTDPTNDPPVPTLRIEQDCVFLT